MAAISDWQEPYRQGAEERLPPIENVVLPLDGSEIARNALPFARGFANLYRAMLHIVYVGERLHGPKQTLSELGLRSEEMRGAVLDHLSGDPAQSIEDTLGRLRAPLAVMSTHAGTDAREALVGQLGQALLNSDDVDRAVLVPPEAANGDWKPRHVLLAHDGARSTDIATWQAADVAHRAAADIIAMHVAARTAPASFAPGSMPAPRYLDQPQHEWPTWANEFLDRMMALGAAPAKVRFKLMVTGGQPGSEIADFARDSRVDLVVAAWHGAWHQEEAGALNTIVRRSGCPVLLVHAPTSKPRER